MSPARKPDGKVSMAGRPPFESIDSGHDRFITTKSINITIDIETQDSAGERHTQRMEFPVPGFSLYADGRLMIFPVGYKEPAETKGPAPAPRKKRRPSKAQKRSAR